MSESTAEVTHTLLAGAAKAIPAVASRAQVAAAAPSLFLAFLRNVGRFPVPMSAP